MWFSICPWLLMVIGDCYALNIIIYNSVQLKLWHAAYASGSVCESNVGGCFSTLKIDWFVKHQFCRLLDALWLLAIFLCVIKFIARADCYEKREPNRVASNDTKNKLRQFSTKYFLSVHWTFSHLYPIGIYYIHGLTHKHMHVAKCKHTNWLIHHYNGETLVNENLII